MVNPLTLVPEDGDHLEYPLGVGAGLVVLHLGRHHVTDAGRPTPDGPRRPVQGVRVTLLQRVAALVDVLQNVTLWGQKGGKG